MKNHYIDRRKFLLTTGGAAAGAMIAGTTHADPEAGSSGRPRRSDRIRLALVGTGIRGTGMWGRDVVRHYSDVVEYVGMCDINPGRLA